MWFDIFLQVAMILGGVFMFLWMHGIPQKLIEDLKHRRNQSKYEAKRHFVRGAQLLSQARSSSDKNERLELAKSAEFEAESSIRLDPTDAASHILKALALDFQGFKTSALSSLESALSPLAVKSLTGEERGDALFKRAEIKIEVNRLEGVDPVVMEDLIEAVRLRPENGRGWCLLGRCYERDGKQEKAKDAFEEALKLDPNSKPAREALDRLRS